MSRSFSCLHQNLGVILFICLCVFGTAWASGENETFWNGATMHGESLLFIKEGDRPPQAPLLFKAQSIQSVRLGNGSMKFEAGRDYLLKNDGRTLELPVGSRVPFMKREQLQPLPVEPRSIAASRDGKHHVFYSEDHFFHDQQAVVDYTHDKDEWQQSGGIIPKRANDQLKWTLKKLAGGENFKLLVLGDSISVGCNATSFLNVPPFQPSYSILVKQGLETCYHCKVELRNDSKGGMVSDWGVGQAAKAADFKPDLAILAFGMNDASFNIDPKIFAQHIRGQMTALRKGNPNAEFILVATSLGNPDWTGSNLEKYRAYRTELLALQGEGAAVADMTGMWECLLKHKQYVDLTGNGVNHPNDFGHRIYAQLILSLLR